jgi:uncharacterized membrane protein YesL
MVSRIMAGLTTLFNVLALNLALLVASLPVITAPAAARAATVALDRWRGDGEDRVVREFAVAFRQNFWRATVQVGVPFAAAALGLAEVDHFAHDRAPAAHLALGLGLGALVITLTGLGYVLTLAGTEKAGQLWSACATLAVRNIAVTGPLFLVELAGAAAFVYFVPALALFGVPLLLLQLMRVTAHIGLGRATSSRSVIRKELRG